MEVAIVSKAAKKFSRAFKQNNLEKMKQFAPFLKPEDKWLLTHCLIETCKKAEGKSLQTTRFLLDSGANPQGFINKGKRTPLYWACRSGAFDVFNLLVARGAVVDKKDKNTHYLFTGAVKSRNIKILITLFEKLRLNPLIKNPAGIIKVALHKMCDSSSAEEELALSVIRLFVHNMRITHLARSGVESDDISSVVISIWPLMEFHFYYQNLADYFFDRSLFQGFRDAYGKYEFYVEKEIMTKFRIDPSKTILPSFDLEFIKSLKAENMNPDDFLGFVRAYLIATLSKNRFPSELLYLSPAVLALCRELCDKMPLDCWLEFEDATRKGYDLFFKNLGAVARVAGMVQMGKTSIESKAELKKQQFDMKIFFAAS